VISKLCGSPLAHRYQPGFLRISAPVAAAPVGKGEEIVPNVTVNGQTGSPLCCKKVSLAADNPLVLSELDVPVFAVGVNSC